MKYAVYLCGGDDRLEVSDCPGGAHTPAPAGYTDWFEWAARMAKTHLQRRCPECGRLAVWVPKLVASRGQRI